MCTNFRTSLFRSYVLPSLLYGSQFLDEPSVRLLDKKMRQFGRRLLMWPRGAPGAAVVGELGWCPLSVEVRRLQFSLFSRLSAAGGTDDGRTLASRVFNYAVRSPGSWAHDVKLLLQSTGSPLPADVGVLPGAQAAQLQWRRSVARPLLHCQALAQYRSEVVAVPSLRNPKAFS